MVCPDALLLLSNSGADDQDRTGDLVLTKDVLCQLSYIGPRLLSPWRSRQTSGVGVERETGIEPATNSLEGCDSTTELLPPSRALQLALATRSPLLRSVPYKLRSSRS